MATARLQPATMLFTLAATIRNRRSSVHREQPTINVQSAALWPPASVFDAELTAVLLACKQIRNKLPGNYVIASHSMSVLTALQNNEHSTKSRMSLVKCRSILCRLHKHNYTVTLLWTQAHVGIDGNERADALAKEAAINSTESPYAAEWHSNIPILKARIRNIWQTKMGVWRSGPVIPAVNLMPWSKQLNEATERAEL